MPDQHHALALLRSSSGQDTGIIQPGTWVRLPYEGSAIYRFFARVAQLVEHLVEAQSVGGSIPSPRTRFYSCVYSMPYETSLILNRSESVPEGCSSS